MDPLPDGSGFRGWADRLAELLAAHRPDLRYANLAVRGKLARQVRAEQLDAALALEPDLVSLLSGLNDMLRRTVDVDGVVGRDRRHGRARCAPPARTCCCSRCPTRCRSTRSPRPPRRRLRGSTPRSARSRAAAARSSSTSTRTRSPPTAGCGTTTGCTRTRRATSGSPLAAAHALGLPDADASWTDAFPDPLGPPLARLARGLGGRYFTPWLIRRLRGRSSGDGSVGQAPGARAAPRSR